MPDTGNRTYLLRIWRETAHDVASVFRAALTDVATHEVVYFTDAQALARHLRGLGEGIRVDGRNLDEPS